MTLVVPFPLFYLYVTISLFILLTFALYLPRYLGWYDSGYLNTYMSSSDDVPNNSILFYPIRKILLVSRYIIGTITSVSIQTEHSDLFLSNYKNSICFYPIRPILLDYVQSEQFYLFLCNQNNSICFFLIRTILLDSVQSEQFYLFLCNHNNYIVELYYSQCL